MDNRRVSDDFNVNREENEEILRRAGVENEKNEIREAAGIDAEIRKRKSLLLILLGLWLMSALLMTLGYDLVFVPKAYESFNPEGEANKSATVTVDRMVAIADEKAGSGTAGRYFKFFNDDGSEGVVKLESAVYDSEEVKAVIVEAEDAVTDKKVTFYGKTVDVPLNLKNEFLNSGVMVSLGNVYLDGETEAEKGITAFGVVIICAFTVFLIGAVLMFFQWRDFKKRKIVLKHRLGGKYPENEKQHKQN